MEENAEFKIIRNIGELSFSQRDVNSLKTHFRCLSDSEYELFFTFFDSFRIIYCKFSLFLCSSNVDNKDIDHYSQEEYSFKLHLWKIFHLPFNINHFAVSSRSLWTLGKNFFVDINSHLIPIIQANESVLQIEADHMEIDPNDDDQQLESETSIEINSFQEYKPFNEKFFINCNFFGDSIFICSKNLISMTWQLDLITPSYDVPFGTENCKVFQLFNFPIFYKESFVTENLPSTGKQIGVSYPVITFIYNIGVTSGQTSNALEVNFFKKLLGTVPFTTSNCICLIGHPEGKLLYCFCGVSNKEQNMHVDSQPEIIYDIKQPIKGIHFLKEPNSFKENGALMIIGKLGKLVFITVEKVFHNSNIFKVKNEAVYVTTLYLPTSVETYVLLNQSIYFISNKFELWITKFSKQTSVFPRKDELKLSGNVIAMHGIVKIVLLKEQQGIFLLVTTSGALYLSEYCKQQADFNLNVSLPSLMNMIMHQSSVLQDLNLVSKMQQDFFASVSKFASIKFQGIPKFEIACAVTEIDEPPTKYVVNINIATSETFDSRFWFVVVYLHSFYQRDSIVISKTLPFETYQKITIEVQESLLCPPHSSAFPLFLEVGLLLTLPESFKYEESFKLIADTLPLYIKIETSILNELFLLKSKPDCKQNKNQHDSQSSKNALREICVRNLKKPIAHALQISHKLLTDYPQDFSFCLFPASSKTTETLVESLTNIMLQKFKKRSCLSDASELQSLTCRNHQLSCNVSDNSDATYIMLRSKSFFLLVGLRMAIMELLLYIQNKSNSGSSKYVSISASINKECEKLSSELLSMYGQDVEAEGFAEKIISMYCQLRKISRQLPFS